MLLGGLWLLDGALQLQPFMFTEGFARSVVLPAASGQPFVVAATVHLAARLIAATPLVADAVLATVQLTIGLLLVSGRAPRLALSASGLWGLSVWLVGEGLGGLASLSGNLLSGAPGAAFFYVVCSLAAWPSASAADAGTRALRRLLAPGRSELAPRPVAARGLSLSFLIGALLQLLPANGGRGGLAGVFESVAPGAPGPLGEVERGLAHLALLGGRPLLFLLASSYLLTAALLLLRGRPGRTGAVLAGILGAFAWIFGQGLGQLYSGQATDPNAGLVVVLLAVTALAAKRRGRRAAPAWQAARQAGPLAA